jgi:D-beta-D-heptose 7-phosphate kinase/D-beta-D-heptose 1-phosphate adenosyltransferase
MINIFVNGTFDLLHPGHIALLNHAKSLGGEVTVAIDSDHRVKSLKGTHRPYYNQRERSMMLLALRDVDRVLIFDSDHELESICAAIKPDVMVKGSDWQGQPVIGQQHCGRIEWFDRIDKYSTSSIYENIADR